MNRLQTFFSTCLWRILNIWWRDKVGSADLWGKNKPGSQDWFTHRKEKVEVRKPATDALLWNPPRNKETRSPREQLEKKSRGRNGRDWTQLGENRQEPREVENIFQEPTHPWEALGLSQRKVFPRSWNFVEVFFCCFVYLNLRGIAAVFL